MGTTADGVSSEMVECYAQRRHYDIAQGAFMTDLDFKRIAARGGSVENAFEELCCQLAARTRPPYTSFKRLRGAGGDGGVECYFVDVVGELIGWQAKYVFDIDGLLEQSAKSLETALNVHKNLTRYVVCFPFDLTGKTARRGKSQTEKFDAWVKRAEAGAAADGRALSIERRSAHDIRQILLEIDVSGGIRHYFFEETTLSDEWFSKHLASAVASAGPRYSARINLQTPIVDWFASFGEEPTWRRSLESKVEVCRRKLDHLRSTMQVREATAIHSGWSDAAHALGIQAADDAQRSLDFAAAALGFPTEETFFHVGSSASKLLRQLDALDALLAEEINSVHGKGTSESKQFRAFMAGYQVSFPAANLDAVRSMRAEWLDMLEWVDSPSGCLAFRSTMVLTGVGGAGKTHSLCDMGLRRLVEGRYTCIAFGHQFGGSPDPWTRLSESLALPPTLGRDGLLDALESAAIASGSKLVVCIDAVNETAPRSYWRDRLSEIAHSMALRPNLKLCISCRTSFLRLCLPTHLADLAVDHQGFAGMERSACNAFFNYYGLQPPLVPVLQPELANPLYVKLVCQTLSDLGLTALPHGWSGIAPVVRAMLAYKEGEFSKEFAVSQGAAIVVGSLMAIAGAIASSGNTSIPWGNAQEAVIAAKPASRGLPVIDWLITADLLIEDGPTTTSLDAENVVRLAFERFGDLLVASKILDEIRNEDIRKVFLPGGAFAHLTADAIVVQDHAGLLAALSILLPESKPGIEISDVVADSVCEEITSLAVRALPWRTPNTFHRTTQRLLRNTLESDGGFEAMDSILAVATQKSCIDARWLHEILGSLPLAIRDSFFCGYLLESYEKSGIVRGLIDAARDVDLARVETGVAERWSIMLVWFTAASDRRVKDFSTRAAVDLLKAHPSLIVDLVASFLRVNDDEVRERVLLIAYGALILAPDDGTLRAVSTMLLQAYEAARENFQNAIIRDHMRCIAEFAQHRGCLEIGLDPLLPMERNLATESPLPPDDVVVDERMERGAEMVKHSCLDDDFQHYSIECLRPWNGALRKPEIGRWIADQVINAFGYRSSRAEDYDNLVVRETGGGRSKPAWAERIGKKYQWVSMYQLASRLHDSAGREKDPYERVTSRIPLILLEERKMDPTIRPTVRRERRVGGVWWLGQDVDLAATMQLEHKAWIKLKKDLPSMESLLRPLDRNGQRWLPLVCYSTWSDYQSDRPHHEPYRSTWIHLEAYVVREAAFDRALEALTGRNFFGKWLPEGARWLYTFVGEYPWASSCNIETDEWRGFRGVLNGAGIEITPVHNEVNCEWEYDGSLPHSINFHVPARLFFEGTGLWWDGNDGYVRSDGRSVFRDPSASEGGPGALLVDLDHILTFLRERGYRLLWTLLGEKTILGERRPTSPQVTYSQVGYLDLDGNIVAGKRFFFDDHSKSTGIKPAMRRTRSKRVSAKREE